ncbi:LysR family transcriptional regulator [Litoreibacter roseus]|uniref:LysR family transcriptional regulator n=1 Tax=Litoreibacter roseus TaxID=2601869 RepID=A0A6N6JKK0_9RHOB|nr:LysR family transcriptional regulator [Litoreibacter roseus]GFE65732.1 LysR family transcriptional regulator [Litoreibacter roseus]
MTRIAETAFLKTVDLGSIRAAARVLGQDPTGLSRRITALEQRLGAKLLDRAGGVTRPTARGQAYAERLRAILDQFDALEAEVSGENVTPTGILRVTAAIDFGQEFLARWLMEFRRMHPGLDVDLILASGFVDFGANNIDVAIRAGALPDSSLVARKLADLPRVLVASPDYLARRGIPETPADLEDHEFVLFSDRNRSEPLTLIGPDGQSVRVRRARGIAINAVRSAVAAVVAGQGIHVGPLWAFADQLDRGTVKHILPDFTKPALPLYAVRQPSTVVPARTAHFIDFVSEKVKGVPGLTVKP